MDYMNYWLMKTEPDAYSIDDLRRDKKTLWDGIRNYQARNFMLYEMRIDDTVLIYHSNCKEPAIAGEGTIAAGATPDPSQFNPQSKYYDPKSDPQNPRWHCVTIKYKSTYKTPITLATLRTITALNTMRILRPGNRLSITPITKAEYKVLHKMLK